MNQSYQRLPVISFLLIALMLLLSACAAPAVAPADDGATDAAGEAAADAPAEEITLTVWNWSQEQEEFYDRVAEAFKEEYPNVTVDWQTRALPQHTESLPLAFQSGESPDIFFYDGVSTLTHLSELQELDWAQPLVNMPEDWMSRWPEGSFAEGVTRIGEDLYSFPLQDSAIWGGGYLFFNKEILEQAGLDPENPPATRGEFLEACAAIAENTDAYCLSNPMQPANELQRIWIGIAGPAYTSDLFDYQAGRYNIDDPRHLESFNYIQSLYENEYVLPGVYDKATARAAMGSGQAGFYFGGAWMPSVLNGMGFDNENVGMALSITPDEGYTGAQSENPLGTVRTFISSQTEYPEEASAFIEFITRPDGYYAQGYVNEGFGTLQFADMSNMEDPYLSALAAMATDPENAQFKVIYPQPILACPEVAASTAQIAADQIRPGWEWEEMQLALVEGEDFSDVAAEIAAAKNEAFQAQLAEEGNSIDCYAFPEFDYMADYTPDMYN